MSETRRERIERSTSRFSDVTRIGLRVVIVAGFAGAAWAMSASVAHAAAGTTKAPSVSDTVTAPLTSLVTDLGGGALDHLIDQSSSADAPSGSITDTVVAPLGDALRTTAKPLVDAGSGVLSQVLAPTNTVLSPGGTGATRATKHSLSAPHHRHAPDVVFGAAAPAVAAVQSAGPHDAVGKDATSAGSSNLVRTITEFVAPLGLDQLAQTPLDAIRPMIGMVDPLTAPLSELLSPITGVLCDVTTPIFDSLGSLTLPVADLAMRPTDGPSPSAPAPLVADLPVGDSLAPPADDVPAAPEMAALGTVPVRVVAGASESQAAAGISHATPAHHRSHTTSVDRSDTPAPPVPLQAPPASGLGGISTMGSGSHEDNGGLAVLSTPIVNGSVALPRLLMSTGLAVRRQIDESPTVSPD
jgi:hypothetical protein